MLKRSLLSVTLAVAVGLASVIPSAAAEGSRAGMAPVRQPAASKVNGITQAAVKAGVLSCTSRINQVTNFLTVNAQGIGAFLFLPPNDPDQQLISVSLEIPSNDTSSAYASASFAPNQANGCAGMYETVVYWYQKCSEVASKNFGALKKIDAFSKNITVLDGGVSTKIFLMSAGTGCVSIKKEVIQ